MPVNISDVSSINNMSVKYPPKEHDKRLTGVGKNTGLLCAGLNPLKLTEDERSEILYRRRTKTVKELQHVEIPLSIRMGETDCDRTPSAAVPLGNSSILVSMMPHDITITTKPGDKNFKRKVSVMYEICFFENKGNGNSYPFSASYTVGLMSNVYSIWNNAGQRMPGMQCYWKVYTSDPLRFVIMLEDGASGMFGNLFGNGMSSSDALQFKNALRNYVTNYSVYDGVCEALSDAYENVKQLCAHVASTGDMKNVRKVLSRMEEFAFPIEDYSEIYDNLSNTLGQAELNSICERNTTLFAISMLNTLNSRRTLLHTFGAPSSSTLVPSGYSKAQTGALTDTSPLVLVQSGAGTGKSTVVLGRIHYMVSCGVRPEDIMVLSFTNAAADHIKEKCPGVRSMTIASMLHTLYSANFRNHMLSSEYTLSNLLHGLKLPDDKKEVARSLQRYLKIGEKCVISGLTAFYNFVSDNYDTVIELLNTVGQTTLTLEVIICIIAMENLKTPAEIMCSHMIIDESQDNSMLELIYVLKHTSVCHNSLFMVGDCSQTLYEFRHANPDTLNTLEASGMFSCHVLETNYRSTQPILDFANLVLENIRANRYANIRLKSNSLSAVNSTTFKDQVKCEYFPIASKKNLCEWIPGILASAGVMNFIKGAMAKHEKVAILSYARKTASAVYDAMVIQHPSAKVINACPRLSYDITMFSYYVSHRWDAVAHYDMANLLNNICTDMRNRFCKKDSDANAVNEFHSQMQGACTAWYALYAAGQMTKEAMLEQLRQQMILFETRYNALRRNLASSYNEKNKTSDETASADIIISTVHSVKGLEYDHVIVIYDDDAVDEESKRLYYVALTRAMKSEYVIAYGKKPDGSITARYDEIVERLDPMKAVC